MSAPYFRMLRYRLPGIVTTALTLAMMSLGVLFSEEFGDPLRNQTEFQNLLSYSPLHNIKVPNGTHQYPATLLTVGKHQLCHAHHPNHANKTLCWYAGCFSAILQALSYLMNMQIMTVEHAVSLWQTAMRICLFIICELHHYSRFAHTSATSLCIRLCLNFWKSFGVMMSRLYRTVVAILLANFGWLHERICIARCCG